MSNIVPKELKISLRTADQTRRAELDLADASLGSEVIQSAVDNWALPADTDYSLVNTTTGEVLSPDEKLAGKIREGDVLAIWPPIAGG